MRQQCVTQPKQNRLLLHGNTGESNLLSFKIPGAKAKGVQVQSGNVLSDRSIISTY